MPPKKVGPVRGVKRTGPFFASPIRGDGVGWGPDLTCESLVSVACIRLWAGGPAGCDQRRALATLRVSTPPSDTQFIGFSSD